jgi:hypothetical protein
MNKQDIIKAFKLISASDCALTQASIELLMELALIGNDVMTIQPMIEEEIKNNVDRYSI